jgi:glycosyltransferase involved in cell wall biosynthesis
MSNHNPSPLSVMHVLWSGSVGGIARLVGDLVDEQMREGLEVGVAFGQAVGPFAETMRQAGARSSHLGLATGYDLRPVRSARAKRLLATADVIHLHGYNPAFDLLCRWADRPVVFTEHGNFAHERSVPRTHAVKERLKARFLRHSVAAVAANSNYTMQRIGELYAIEGSRVRVVYNGIRGTEFVSGGTGSGDVGSSIRVVFLGRLVGVKRVDRLIDAVARMHERRHVSVAIVGGGPLAADLQRQAHAAGVADRIAFLGYCRNVDAILSTADVVVQPSTGEAFGLAILEACAAGALPIAFSDGGGALEALPPDGIVVDDADGLASALDRLIRSSATAPSARLGRAVWARERFPISRTHELYLELYASALAGHSS